MVVDIVLVRSLVEKGFDVCKMASATFLNVLFRTSAFM